jgi:hypothetical protein
MWKGSKHPSSKSSNGLTRPLLPLLLRQHQLQLPCHTTHMTEAPAIGHFTKMSRMSNRQCHCKGPCQFGCSWMCHFNFRNQATALEAMGPIVKSQRTGGNKHVIPKGCHGSEYKCMHCSCKCLVVFKVYDLASDSTKLYAKGQESHQKHNPPTWRDGYEYKLIATQKSGTIVIFPSSCFDGGCMDR